MQLLLAVALCRRTLEQCGNSYGRGGNNVSSEWYAVALLVALVVYYAVRRWLAFRQVNALIARRQQLGSPLGRTRSEVEAILGPPSRSPEGTADEQLLVWRAEGHFSVLDTIRFSECHTVTLRFVQGVCTEDISDERARTFGPD